VQPLGKWDGGWGGGEIDSEHPGGLVALTMGENVPQDAIKARLACDETIDNEIAEQLALMGGEQRRAAFAEAQYHDSNARARLKVGALEMVEDVEFEPRLQQHSIERFMGKATELFGSFPLHNQACLLQRAGSAGKLRYDVTGAADRGRVYLRGLRFQDLGGAVPHVGAGYL
jgi:hypothetical protein